MLKEAWVSHTIILFPLCWQHHELLGGFGKKDSQTLLISLVQRDHQRGWAARRCSEGICWQTNRWLLQDVRDCVSRVRYWCNVRRVRILPRGEMRSWIRHVWCVRRWCLGSCCLGRGIRSASFSTLALAPSLGAVFLSSFPS